MLSLSNRRIGFLFTFDGPETQHDMRYFLQITEWRSFTNTKLGIVHGDVIKTLTFDF